MILILWIVVAALVGYLGRGRKAGFWGIFVLSILLTPMIGLIILLLTIKNAGIAQKTELKAPLPDESK